MLLNDTFRSSGVVLFDNSALFCQGTNRLSAFTNSFGGVVIFLIDIPTTRQIRKAILKSISGAENDKPFSEGRVLNAISNVSLLVLGIL
jgi:hypothetical protein